ncbi:2-keto-gluconate dehydrogenase [Mycolicibacter terrae]|uniref:2-keto-gluconate dehydrogenase n=1 Tax=Mycolicibacter terrae TaxID=1788 RepID=A0AAD1MFF2_9MYCO|nr:GMC family oxidoreductase [Mycolicibacter terrae]ORW96922.1 2-keto-gluconate dehydrogenase [Mycolicibacter terrae]BBX22392.1 2-keto-gluconate dehydrogenase [Mycolicibacter terrae]SNV75836.1 cholesterol oxidase ChoD [Mycolicibacter terrae]
MARTPLKVPLDEAVEVVVIGTGAGGGNVIRELCLAGVRVVALEAGPRLDADNDFEEDEVGMYHKLSWLDPVGVTGPDISGSAAWICKTVGGSTTHWAGAALRWQPHEFKAKTTYGDVEGADLVDWPIDYETLAPYYDKAEKLLGVAGAVTRLPKGNTNFLALKRGADALGIDAHAGNIAITTEDYLGRGICTQRGYCFQGCRNQAKWSSLFEAIPTAEDTGWLDLRPNCQALTITTDDDGRASGVVYADPTGRIVEQKAQYVVVAGNSIQTPRLLLNSATPRFPDGLANGSGAVGRYYMRHLTASSFAKFQQPVHAYKGITMMGMVDEWHDNRPGERGFVGGFHLETIFLGPAFTAVFVAPGPLTSTSGSRALWGEQLADMMESYTHLAGLWIVGEDMPQADNRVTVDPDRKDQFGMPIPVVNYADHPNDSAMREFAWGRSRDLYTAGGATTVWDTPPYPATHNMGTCRMGTDPSSSVVNEFGQAHEVPNLFIADGSVFPTSGSENPTLTISALAIRQAEYITSVMAEEMSG